MSRDFIKHTKIIWPLDLRNHTLQEYDLKSILCGSINGIRLVGSQNPVADSLAVLKVRNELNAKISVVLDLSPPPALRITDMKQRTELQYGERLTVRRGAPLGDADLGIQINDPNLKFKHGTQIYVDYGVSVLEVEKVEKELLHVVVNKGGPFTNTSELLVPEHQESGDVEELIETVESLKNVPLDYLIVPRLSRRDELSLLRKKLSPRSKKSPWLILKIDSKTAFERRDEAISFVDGFLISRLEMATTCSPAIVPMLTKELIGLANKNSKVIFIASEMLASMKFNPTPTRAEVSDIANAVIDGTDAVVLSEDISSYRFKDQALAVCNSIIQDLEDMTQVAQNWNNQDFSVENILDAVAFHALHTVNRVQAKALVCITKEGTTARKLASLRASVPIVAVTFSEHAFNKLSLVRGVHPMMLTIDPNLDEVLPLVMMRLKEEHWVESKDKIVFVTLSLSPIGKESSNLFTIQTME